ncbi:helix-turn-helix domain-containing protein [Arthrobacter globiformis]|uniref:helix-turn-helix domain-containing protein n=1 Tax=Arthrobacter globiformis TaxID=1665 RepID=UPI000B41389E|nr:helix-turn-helix domain-containing protein [Arthrobacter globiformis]
MPRKTTEPPLEPRPERPGQNGRALPRMLSLAQVQEVLNMKAPQVYSLVRSGELRAAQFGGRGIWRVREDDLAAYIDAAYAKTAERIAAGQISEGETPAED